MNTVSLLEKFGMHITNLKPPVCIKQGEMRTFSHKRMFPAGDNKIEIGKYQISFFVGQGLYYVHKDMMNDWTGARGQWVVGDFTLDQAKSYVGSAILQSFILRDGKYYEESLDVVKVGWELYTGPDGVYQNYHKMGHLGMFDSRVEDLRTWRESDGTWKIYDSRHTAARSFKFMCQKLFGFGVLTKDNFIIESQKNPVRGVWSRDGGFVIGSGQNLGILGTCKGNVEKLHKSLTKEKPKLQQELPLEGAEELVAAGVQV